MVVAGIRIKRLDVLAEIVRIQLAVLMRNGIISIVYPPTTPAFSHPSFPEVV